MKKVTYNGLIYTVEQTRLRNDEVIYQLSGGEWVAKKDTIHWLAGWFYKFFNAKYLTALLFVAIGLFVVFQVLRFYGLIVIAP